MEDRDSASLQAAMEVSVTSSLGPMGPLLRQLVSLMASGHDRPEDAAVKAEIQILKEDLDELCISLKDLSEAEDPSFTAKWWMKEVRELFYDTEDYIEESMHPGAFLTAEDGGSSAFTMEKIHIFSQLMARMKVANEWLKEQQLAPFKTIKRGIEQAGATPSTVEEPMKKTGDRRPVGIEKPMEELVNKLSFGDPSEAQLKVVSIFGVSGVGKTTLARVLYDEYRGQFQCHAFLRVSRNPDMRRLLTNMLSQIKAPWGYDITDVGDLIDSVAKHLQGKRYFIIADDLWSASVWDVITCAFPMGSCHSRIITTTQIDDVALACCSYYSEYIYELSPLNDGQSKKLFFGRLFSSEEKCPPDLKDISNDIIRKCRGLPLATANIASLLASEEEPNRNQWKHIRDSLPLQTCPTSEVIKEVLNLIYNSLSPHLKTCLLYLIMYTEGYTIRKDDLVKQWVAEVFIEEGREMKEKMAGSYFDELVSRGMIQPVDTNGNHEVLSCTVHHMVLDLLRCKSMEENFVITVGNYQTAPVLPDKVRRLSIQFGGAKGAMVPECIRMSQVRSLVYCGFFKCVPTIGDYRFLRVLSLHIWADHDKTAFDLSRIGELSRLRYLKIECNVAVKLPVIGRLRNLGTLQLDAKLCDLPLYIGVLDKLLNLRLSIEATVRNLGNLTNLQDLQLTCSTMQQAEDCIYHLTFIIKKFPNLKSVILVPVGSIHANTLDGAGTSSRNISLDGFYFYPDWLLIERLELLPRIFIFPRFPKWIRRLNKLSILKIAVRELSMEEFSRIQLLGLTALSLHVQTTNRKRISFCNGAFPVLKYFKFRSSVCCLRFEADSMPSLEKLKLDFDTPTLTQYGTMPIWIEPLSGLKDICIKIGVASIDAFAFAKSMVKNVVWNHQSNPKINIKVQLVSCSLSYDPEGAVDCSFYGDEGMVDYSFNSATYRRIQTNRNWNLEEFPTQHEASKEEVNRQSNSSYLRVPVMEDAMVSVSTGTTNTLGWKLAALMGEGYAKHRFMREVVMIPKDELDFMNAFLHQLAGNLELSMQFKNLGDQMRDMTYHVDDSIDSLMLHWDKQDRAADCARDGETLQGSGKDRSILGAIQRGSGKDRSRVDDMPDKDSRKDQKSISDKWGVLIDSIHQMRDLIAKASKADPPIMKYMTDESRLPTLSQDNMGAIAVLVCIEGPREEIVQKMIGHQQLQVACILGDCGVGKSTLATEVYNHIKGPEFGYQVFIKVSKKDDLIRLLNNIVSQLSGEQSSDVDMNMEDLILMVASRLQHKRYLVVLDGFWSAQTWKDIKRALPQNNLENKIIITTSLSSVAKSCVSHSSDFIYTMEPLCDPDALNLFRRIIFGSQKRNEKKNQTELEEVAKKIVAACGGIPLAIILIAGLLSIKPAEVSHWEIVLKCMEPAGKGDHPMERIRKIFHISYSHLPDDMKSCLLYLSVFPENHFIRKDRLIWRWIAEGFIPRRAEESPWETGESYFQQLMARKLIRQAYGEEVDYEVSVGCQVHGLVHDFITSLSSERNLVQSNTEQYSNSGYVIRLSVKDDTSELKSVHLSRVRSLTCFVDIARVPTFGDWRFVRVLDLEGTRNLGNHHLQSIAALSQLRYLGLRGTGIKEFYPFSLTCMETLDLRGTNIISLSGMLKMPRLARLLVQGVSLSSVDSSWIQEISMIIIDDGECDRLVPELFNKLPQLKLLGVQLMLDPGAFFEGKTVTSRRSQIMAFIQEVKSSNLQTLFLHDYPAELFDLAVEHFVPRPPHHLQEFGLRVKGPVSRVPDEMEVLVNLVYLHIDVEETSPRVLGIFGGLPKLSLLKLSSRRSADRRHSISSDEFRCLKVLWVISENTAMTLQFTKGSLPQLRRIQLDFNALKTIRWCSDFEFGIQHLQFVRQVRATINCDGCLPQTIEAAEAAIRNQASQVPNSPTVELFRQSEHLMRRFE